MRKLDVRLLGTFDVLVDGRPVPADAWAQRRATDLVKLLALSRNHRLPREQVLDALWPTLAPEAAAANLHKAASYARQALGDRGAVVLRGGGVELAPDAEVTTDVERFEAGDADAYRGELLPDDPYEPWTVDVRAQLRDRRIAALRAAERWEEVLREDPADEESHRALMRRHASRGDRAAAAQQFRLLQDQLARVGNAPSAETLALRQALARGPAVHAPRFLDTPVEGRERELDTALAAVRRAADGDGGALLIRGAFGFGKTRILEAVLAEAERSGFHTLRGAAHEEEGRPPYAPAVDALDPLVAGRPELAAALADDSRAVLARLLPSAGPSAVPEVPAERHRVFFALSQLVAGAAAERGAVLAVDDLHAADEATTAFVHHLARGAAGTRLLVVAAIHDEPLEAHTARMRSALLGHGSATEIVLTPLDAPAVAAVAARAAGRPLLAPALREVQRCAAGNPLFAAELGASLDASGALSVPPRLQAVVGRRLDQLPSLDEALVAALAVADDGFTAAELAALAGGPEVEAALEAAVAVGVLDRTGDRHRFRHALVREELARRVPEDALRRAHAMAAEMLAAEDATPEAIAHHLVRAGRGPEAVPLLHRAAEWAAGVGAYRDGAGWADQALEYAGPDARPALLALRARLLHGAGDPRAPAAFTAAIGAAAPADVTRLRIQQARACLAAGDVAGAVAAVDGVTPARPQDTGDLLLVRGMVAWHSGDRETARRSAAEAERLAPDPAEATTLKALVAHLDGGWEQHSRRQLTEIWDTPELAGRVHDSYLCVTEYVLTAGDPYDGVAAFAKRLRARARQAGAIRGEAFATTVLGETELFTGNLDAARAHLADAVRLSREAGATAGESLARTRLGEALLHGGDRAGARAQLDQALELAHACSITWHIIYYVYAALLQVPEDAAEALAIADRAETVFEPSWVCGFCPTAYHVAAATVCARAGQLERAHAELAYAEHGAAAWPAGSWPAAVAEARAELLQAEGDAGAAGDALRRAADGYAAAGQHLLERRARAALERLGATA